MFLSWVRDYSEYDCYYTELERTGCRQRLLQFQPMCLEDESPDRMPRRMTASSLCLSAAVVKPHHALDAYVSVLTTTI